MSAHGGGFPGWCPNWLKQMVLEPDCTVGTHPTLRQIAKWLVVYMPPDKNPGLADKWLKEAAERCDRVPDDSELKRLLSWACGVQGQNKGEQHLQCGPVKVDLDRIFELVISGPHRSEYRELSPTKLYEAKERQTAGVLDVWARYSGIDDPWVCYGSDDQFWTNRLSFMRADARIFAQVVPSPMRRQYGRAIDDGHLSHHTLDGTGPRLFLVTEFDFSPVTRQRKPSAWAPLIKRCADRGYSVLDMNAALSAYLRGIGPLWMTVYSGGKSLQSWFACKNTPEPKLEGWFRREARSIGACSSTWSRSQFVRMPDGSRDDGARQSIEYFNPEAVTPRTENL
jgi:hypothetical protein